MSVNATVTTTSDPPSDGDAPPDGPSGAGGGTRWFDRRLWLAGLLVAGFVIQVLWRLFLVRELNAPAAHADEDGYLVAARALAGGAGGYSTENALFRRAGYPLLITPIYWFTSDPFQVYRGVQVLNALLNAAMFPLAYLFSRRVFGVSRGWALSGALLVTTMPAVAFYGQFAMADAVLASFGLMWLLLLHSWLITTGIRKVLSAAGAGLVAGAIYVLHVRGLMVVAAHMAIMLLFLVARRVSWRQIAAGAGALLVGIAVDPLLKVMLGDKIITQGSSPGSQTIEAFTTVNGIGRTVARIIGQLWYLMIGTWGLGAVGLAVLVLALWPLLPLRELRTRLLEPVTGTRTLMLLTTLVTTLLVALGSSMSLPTWDHRINYFAYPRYIHFLFPVWLLVGLFALRETPSRRLLATTGVLLGLASAGTYGAIRFSKAYRFMAFDAPETSFLGWNWDEIKVASPTIAGVALFCLLLLALPRPRWTAAAVTAVVALQVAVMGMSVERISKPMVVDQYRPDTPRLVRDARLGPGDVIAESTKGPWYTRYNHMREVTWSRILLFDHTKEEIPDTANVVIAPFQSRDKRNDWLPGPEYQRVATDSHHGWAVWRRR
jgi:hypothetical protein